MGLFPFSRSFVVYRCLCSIVLLFLCRSPRFHDSIYTLTRSDGIYGMVASSTLLAFTHFSHWFFTLAKPHSGTASVRTFSFHLFVCRRRRLYNFFFLLSHIILRAIKKKKNYIHRIKHKSILFKRDSVYRLIITGIGDMI